MGYLLCSHIGHLGWLSWAALQTAATPPGRIGSIGQDTALVKHEVKLQNVVWNLLLSKINRLDAVSLGLYNPGRALAEGCSGRAPSEREAS
jgi:hypothetical protein